MRASPRGKASLRVVRFARNAGQRYREVRQGRRTRKVAVLVLFVAGACAFILFKFVGVNVPAFALSVLMPAIMTILDICATGTWRRLTTVAAWLGFVIGGLAALCLNSL